MLRKSLITLSAVGGSFITAAGVFLTFYGIFFLIQMGRTDDPKARNLYETWTVVLVPGIPLLLIGIALLVYLGRKARKVRSL